MRTLYVGEKNVISTENPGEYELIRMNLIGPPVKTSSETFENKVYSIMLVYSNFSIFEDLYSNCLSATVTIVDSNSIFTEFPIIGDEFIEIMFRSLNTEISIHLKFRVVRVSELEQINETTNVYTLLLSSPVSILSEKQKISKSFAGINHKTHYIVKNICEKYLNLIDEKTVEVKEIGDYKYKDKQIQLDYYQIESTSGHSEKYISPFLSPFHIINNICKRSVNEKGSLYFFFEDSNRFRFVNIEENVSKKKNGVCKRLIYYPANSIKKTSENSEMFWNIIFSYSIKKRFDVFENMASGMYSSSVTYIDLEKRRTIEKNYYYQREGAEYNHTSDGYLLTSKYSDLIHDDKLETPATVQSVVPFHSGDLPSQDYSSHEPEYFQRRMSMEAQMNGIILEVEIPGDSTGQILIGEFIDISILSVGKENSEEIEPDPYLSGKYMVTRIHHYITKGDNSYRMIIELISDTVFQEYDLNTENEIDSISIQAKTKELELEQDQVYVSTSKKSNQDINMRHAIDRKRRWMNIGMTITEKEIKDVKS